MKFLLTLILGIGFLCPVFSQITATSLTIDNTTDKVGIGNSDPGKYTYAGNQSDFSKQYVSGTLQDIPGSLTDIDGSLVVRQGIQFTSGGAHTAAIDIPLFKASVNQDMRNAGSATGWDVRMQSGTGANNALRMNFMAGHSNTYSAANNALMNDVDNLATFTLYAKDSDRRVGINKESPSYALDVNGQVRADNVTVTSDRRWKKQIESIEGASLTINQLNPSTYFWKSESFPAKKFNDQRQYGLIAQEVEKVIPEIVHSDEEGYKSVDYTSLIAILIKALQEKDGQIKELEAKLASLKSSHESRLAALEAALKTGKIAPDHGE